MPFGRLLAALTLAGGIILTVFGVLAGTGQLAWKPAVIGAVVIIVLQGLMLRAFLNGIATVRDHLAGIRDVEDRLLPIQSASPAARDLWLLITRVLRLYLRRISRLEDELAASKAVLAALPDPIMLIDGKREIRQINQAAAELFGVELTDRDLSVAIRNPTVLTAADAVLRGGPARLIEFDVSVPMERSFRARIERVADDTPSAIVSLTDLTTLKRAEQLRADFVANASHELRTPLSTVIGFIETLEGPASEDREARERFLPIMRQQAARMARLVDDLLSLSRIELNEHLPPRGEVDLVGVLRTVTRSLELKAAARRMHILLESEMSSVPASGDHEELSQVFQNLIDNAIKYGDEGSDVTITLLPSTKLRQGVSIAVRDCGDGIAREHLPRLTERFYRADTARSRAMGGTGLGLAIVKHIVNRHRGMLEIASDEGVGSVFTVHLPVRQPQLKMSETVGIINLPRAQS
jgi:two-component system phosphate regulon sensor histidine kinase PhoR